MKLTHEILDSQFGQRDIHIVSLMQGGRVVFTYRQGSDFIDLLIFDATDSQKHMIMCVKDFLPFLKIIKEILTDEYCK